MGDLNVDHVALYRATLTATRPMSSCPVTDVYAHEVASSTEWAFGTFEPAFRPNTFENIADTLEAKIAAMGMYQSERRAFPHPRPPESLRAAAMRRGSAVGLPAAEAFELIRRVNR